MLWTGPRVAVREWAGRRSARWLPPALAERLLDFEHLDEAWPRGRTAIEHAEIGRQREAALSEIVAYCRRRRR